MNKIVLASASPRRRELLKQIGLEFEVMPGNIEEKAKSLIPSQMVMELSEGKAMDVFEKLNREEQVPVLVVGADTVVAFGDQIMGKPENRMRAVEMLSCLQGSTHQVYTGVTLAGRVLKEKEPFRVSFYEKTDVTMYPMSREEINAYVESGESMDKAGAYGIQGRCAAFIKEIKGDYNNVVGLPIGRLYQEIKKLDYDNHVLSAFLTARDDRL